MWQKPKQIKNTNKTLVGTWFREFRVCHCFLGCWMFSCPQTFWEFWVLESVWGFFCGFFLWPHR